jgi:GTP-binding protein
MIIDEAKLHIRAGHGGAGKVCFSTIPRNIGPTGGNGGNGGSVYVEGVSDLSALRQYRFKKDFTATDGKPGAEANRTGGAGDDLILKVPIGTVVRDLTTRKVFEVTKPGERILIAKGGKGGRGNFEFRSARVTTPEFAQPGLPGEEFEALFELQLIADIGLIGLPNAGKSSLLNELTKAAVRVANYPFTTLEPNLGVYYPTAFYTMSDEQQAATKPLIMADVPGLIEGASSGKGLGFKFLRHIQRTKTLLHCVSAESAAVNEDYKSIRAELAKYDKKLVEKKEYIVLTKTDLVDEATLKKQLTALKRFKKPVLAVSIHNPTQLQTLKELLDSLAE